MILDSDDDIDSDSSGDTIELSGGGQYETPLLSRRRHDSGPRIVTPEELLLSRATCDNCFRKDDGSGSLDIEIVMAKNPDGNSQISGALNCGPNRRMYANFEKVVSSICFAAVVGIS